MIQGIVVFVNVDFGFSLPQLYHWGDCKNTTIIAFAVNFNGRPVRVERVLLVLDVLLTGGTLPSTLAAGGELC